VLDELREAPATRAPYQGTLPLFEARVGCGNPLGTMIPRNAPAVPPTLAQAPEPLASDG